MIAVKTFSGFRQHERCSCCVCGVFSLLYGQGAHLTEYSAILTMALEDMTRSYNLLISEVKVCFLDRHINIISHLTRFVKNFFSSMISSRYPARGQPSSSGLPSLDLSLMPVGVFGKGEGCAWLCCLGPVIRCLLSVD